MKKLSKLKLNALSEANLLDREMNALKGGSWCACSCYYANMGGSSIEANRDANYNNNNGTTSYDGCNSYIKIGNYSAPFIKKNRALNTKVSTISL